MTRELTLRIILKNPPRNIVYGIQKGKGSKYETILKKTGPGDLSFEFNIGVKYDEANNPVFVGPFAQGPTQERFIYIDIGTYAGQQDTGWSRRLKIPLKSISGNTIEKLQPGNILLAEIPGTGGDGEPACGTVNQFRWQPVAT